MGPSRQGRNVSGMPSRFHSARPSFDRPWRDGTRFLIISRHFVPGYYHFVPGGTGTSQACQADSIARHLFPIVPGGRCPLLIISRHFVPGYYRSSLAGRCPLSTHFPALRTGLLSFRAWRVRDDRNCFRQRCGQRDLVPSSYALPRPTSKAPNGIE
jgi:hypothetical protein